jgi:hypothetical protein
MRTGSAPIPDRLHTRAVHRASAIAVALALAQAAACRDTDVVTASYATMAEAREAGAAGREIPSGVPEGAHDIRVARDMNSGRHWGLFNFHPADVDGLRALLQSEETPLDGVECDIPPRIEWWPILLRGPVKAEHAKAAGLQSYRSREGGLIVVVNWKQGRAYYWKV